MCVNTMEWLRNSGGCEIVSVFEGVLWTFLASQIISTHIPPTPKAVIVDN